MTRLPTIDFTWARDPRGYRLTKTAPRRLVRNGPNRTEVLCPPLTGEEFRIFAANATNDAGLLAFVNQYGPLSWMGFDAKMGDVVDHVMWDARTMRDLLAVSADEHSLGPDPGPAYVGSFISVDAAVVWDPASKSLRWQFRPNSLLDALWLQFGQAVTRGAQLRACEHCGAWFEAGAGTGRRADAKFCSDEHRITHNSLKRSKG